MGSQLISHSLIALLTLPLLVSPTVSSAEPAKNIIFMIPDGMGLANVTAARIAKNGPNGAPLSFETLRQIGYQRTHSANSTVTDSAAAASAWACGEKFDNGEVCHHGDGKPSPPSITQRAQHAGKATGLVTTSAITDATPAAFGASAPSRDCRQEIARQYLEVRTIDVLLGGGRRDFTGKTVDPCGTGGDLLETAQKKGYTIVIDRKELVQLISPTTHRLLGLFSERDLTPEYLRTADSSEPDLAEMTAVALTILGKNPGGFFLMVEGSLIDRANHRNNFPYQLGEVLAFDKAVETVRRWLAADLARAATTLLIVVADHETGGFAITGPAARQPEAGSAMEIAWTGTTHTAVDTIVWSEGPGSEKLGRALDNTDLYKVAIESME